MFNSFKPPIGSDQSLNPSDGMKPLFPELNVSFVKRKYLNLVKR